MNEFVAECRREWKRLRVPDPVANEMAADLTADLAEAESEGVSAEQVLGSGAFDPRSFAASWAAERGVVAAPPPVTRDRFPRPSRVLVAVAAAAAVLVTIVVALALLRAHAGVAQVAVAPQPGPGPIGSFVMPGGGPHGVYVRALGVLVLLAGLVGLAALSAACWWRWGNPRRGRSSVDEGLGGPGYS